MIGTSTTGSRKRRRRRQWHTQKELDQDSPHQTFREKLPKDSLSERLMVDRNLRLMAGASGSQDLESGLRLLAHSSQLTDLCQLDGRTVRSCLC